MNKDTMSYLLFYTFIILIATLLITFMIIIVITQDTTERLKICSQNNNTYITFSEGMLKGSYCGDILELKEVIETWRLE